MENPCLSFVRQDTTLFDLVSLLNRADKQTRSVSAKIQSEQIHLAVKNRCPAEIESDVATLLNYRWSKQNQTDTSLRLEMPASAETLERAHNDAKFQGKLEFVQELRRALTLSEPELKDLRAFMLERIESGKPIDEQTCRQKGIYFQHPMYEALLHENFRALFGLMCSFDVPTLKELFSDFGSIHLDWNVLSAAQQQWTSVLAVRKYNGNVVLKEEVLPLLQKYGIHYSSGDNGNYPMAPSIDLANTGMIARTLKMNHYVPMPVHVSPYAADLSKELKDELLRHQKFPSREYRESYPSCWLDAFVQLARLLPYSLYSDAIPLHPVGESDALYVNSPEKPDNPKSIWATDISVEQALNHLCRIYRKVWWRKGNSIFFRTETWFHERESQLPLPLYRNLQEAWAKKGKLEAAHFLSLSKLTRQQLRGMRLYALERSRKIVLNRETSELRRPLQADFFLLRFFASLSEAHQGKALTPEGLPLQDMTTREREAYFDTLLQTRLKCSQMEAVTQFAIQQKIFTSPRQEDVRLGLVKYLMGIPNLREEYTVQTGFVFHQF